MSEIDNRDASDRLPRETEEVPRCSDRIPSKEFPGGRSHPEHCGAHELSIVIMMARTEVSDSDRSSTHELVAGEHR
ncbi:MAG: hypothetical protein ACXV98_00620, partial [Ilumatobacteraceae bacterium]